MGNNYVEALAGGAFASPVPPFRAVLQRWDGGSEGSLLSSRTGHWRGPLLRGPRRVQWAAPLGTPPPLLLLLPFPSVTPFTFCRGWRGRVGLRRRCHTFSSHGKTPFPLPAPATVWRASSPAQPLQSLQKLPRRLLPPHPIPPTFRTSAQPPAASMPPPRVLPLQRQPYGGCVGGATGRRRGWGPHGSRRQREAVAAPLCCRSCRGAVPAAVAPSAPAEATAAVVAVIAITPTLPPPPPPWNPPLATQQKPRGREGWQGAPGLLLVRRPPISTAGRRPHHAPSKLPCPLFPDAAATRVGGGQEQQAQS